MAKTVEELLQENNDLLRSQQRGGGSRGGDGTDNKMNMFGAVADKGISGFSKLAAGTATMQDIVDNSALFIGKFGSVGAVAGDMLKELGTGAINVNNTLKDTGKFGVTFGQNLGAANEAIKGAQLTIPEFNTLIQTSGRSLAGFAGGQNESAKAFLTVTKELQGTRAAQDLKAAGMSSLELGETLSLVSQNSIGRDLKDKKSREDLIATSLVLANEFNQVADLSGKSRKQQMDAVRAINERADIEASILLKSKTDPNFGNNINAASTAMGKFGPKIQELLAEEATGGARSQDALKSKALMGPAAEAIAAYGKAIEGGNADQIAAAKRKAEVAIAERMNSDEYLKTIKVTQGNVLNGGELIKGSFETMKNIQAEQADLARQGKASTVEAAMISLEQKNLLKTTGQKLGADGKPIVDEGAVVGRGINQIENLGKVAGGVIAGGFTKLNEKMGNTINTTIPEFDAKLKGLSSSLALPTPISKGGAAVRSGPGAIAAPAASKESGETTAATKASAANAEATNSDVKDLLTQLNNKMGQLVSISTDANDTANKQVRATRNLSNNRLD